MTIAQTKISLTDKISFNLPEGTVKYQDQKYLKDLENIIDDKQMTRVMMNNMLSYKAQDVIFRFRLVKKISKTPIQSVVENMDNIFSNKRHSKVGKNNLYEGYTRGKKNINGNEIVFSSFKAMTKSKIDFYCYNSARQTAFTGEIIFDEKNKNNMDKIFDNLISSINIE